MHFQNKIKYFQDNNKIFSTFEMFSRTGKLVFFFSLMLPMFFRMHEKPIKGIFQSKIMLFTNSHMFQICKVYLLLFNMK